jgi:cobalt/nickel transport protein
MRRPSTRILVVVGVLVALVLAGVVSFYASSSPDGLNKVAIDQGFSGTEKVHGVAGGPLAGYEAKGISDDRISGGVAGVAGSLTVLILTGGLAFAVRRRGATAGRAPDTSSGP